jgi:mTERF domain-containing protein
MNLLVSNLQPSSGGLSLQVLSLSVENCLKPKYDYLVKELKGNVDMVTSFPAYFSLSLEQRIKPRHQFLVAMNRMPSGPFPMKCLAVTDACFCQQWAKSSLEEYDAFRNDLLLSNFAKKFESKNKVHI